MNLLLSFVCFLRLAHAADDTTMGEIAALKAEGLPAGIPVAAIADLSPEVRAVYAAEQAAFIATLERLRRGEEPADDCEPQPSPARASPCSARTAATRDLG